MQDPAYLDEGGLAERRLELEGKIEDEEEDAADLQETLKRTDAIATRMTQILSSFDDRLIRLEKTIAPIHKQMTKLTALHDNIDATIMQMELVTNYFDLAGREEPVITRGPREDHLQRYMDSVTRVRDAYTYLAKSQFRSADRAVGSLRTLLATGLAKIQDLFRKTLNGVTTTVDLTSQQSFSTIPQPSPQTLEILFTLSSFMSGTEHQGLSYTDVVATYIAVRQPSFAKSILPLSQAATNMAPRVQSYARGSGPHIAYTNALGALAAAEHRVVTAALPPDLVPTSFTGVVGASFATFAEKAEALVVRVKRAASKGDYSEVVVLADLEECMRISLTDAKSAFLRDAGRAGDEIYDTVASYDSTLIGMLKDFYVEIHIEATKPNVSGDGTVHELTSQTLNALKRFLDYPTTFDDLIRQMGDSHITAAASATAGDGSPALGGRRDKSRGRSLAGGEGLGKFIGDCIDALVTTLETKSRTYKKPTLSTVFLLNNYNYVSKAIRASRALQDVVGPDVDIRLDRMVQKQRAAYDDVWKLCYDQLVDNSPAPKQLSSQQREAIKAKFRAFNTAFDETFGGQRSFSIPDTELRQQLVQAVRQAMVPLYAKFYDKYQDVEFTKNQQKYVKFTPQQLEKLLGELFDPSVSTA
ncbi:Exo70 exocyst complex subunit [Gonapodya prolifera JEL478]|uniref:Exocyst complex protein EXO70 n=1 Tax=Gonapodya prolifera (strain JEL478) TaxID=1344416 RepID=A0A139A7Q7_GONPJ|nr:Exo70 exocyst complex subunit [Gonapodya prolifera JEL478]|eukprot:KXS12403.1 Exo70 exocyst complex subunit [Gonapodya prolifera JEL478]